MNRILEFQLVCMNYDILEARYLPYIRCKYLFKVLRMELCRFHCPSY